MNKPRNIIPAASRAHVNWLNYGDPGVGKSQLIGTGGSDMLVLANNMDETVPMRDSGVKIWHTPDYNELTDAVEYVMHEGHKEFLMVWLDNGTLMQDQGMDQIMADLVVAKPHRDRLIPDKAEYMKNQQTFLHLVKTLVQAPVNFGMTAHCMVGTDVIIDEDGDVEEEDYLIPALQGTRGLFSQKICGYMNLVTHMRVAKKGGKEVRVLTTAQTGRRLAKDRYGILPRQMIDPTVPGVLKKIGQAGKPARPARKTTKKASKRSRKTTT